MNGLQQLYSEITSISTRHNGEFNLRMYHRMPDAEVIDRVMFVLKKCMDKIVIDVGCSGSLHKQICGVAKKAYGIDKVKCDTPNFILWDFDNSGGKFPVIDDKIQLIFCGEIVEHLSNPGLFLEGLKDYRCEIIFTVPNAFSKIHPPHLQAGFEHVNIDHVAFYSWRTFQTLLDRYGYKTKEFYWYDAPDQVAPQSFNEGCVFVTEHET